MLLFHKRNYILIELLFFKLIFISSQQNYTSKLTNTYMFQKYNRYIDIVEYILRLKRNHEDKITVLNIGQTHERQKILVVKISLNKKEKNKPVIFIDAGIHAREWITPAVALFCIYQLVEVSKNEILLKNFDWYIIPVVNPDGYTYSLMKDHLWRKNRAPGFYCDGVDLNRNFGIHWGLRGSSKNECSVVYSGPHSFSEPETQALKNIVLSLKPNIKGYLSLHSYGNQILVPWGYTKRPIHNLEQYTLLTNKIVRRIRKVRGTIYRAGQLSKILYYASGTLIDWMAKVAKIPFAVVIEMGDKKWLFKPPKSEILAISKEVFEGIKTFQEEIYNKLK